MNLRIFRTPAAFVFSTVLLATSATAQTRSAAPESPYGGTTVEEVIARVNDQIITRSDYDRSLKELDADARQKGASAEQIAAAHKDLLRNLIDQQLWLSKGKALGITGETELVKRLNDIRKQYHLESLEDLEKAAREQGVSFEDFKANIRNTIITQEVMRQEVGKRVQYTPGEVERYFDQHKQEYAQPESVTLAEILVSTAAPAATATTPGGGQTDDPALLAAAKAKADDIEAKLSAGGDFIQLARTFSDGPTAAAGGDLGQFQRGKLAKVIEDKTFVLKTGQFTEPIRTKQGFLILKVVQHVSGGVPAYKDVQSQVEENLFMARMEPAMREYLTLMREQAFIDIKPGYSDTGASVKEVKPVYSAYVPPAPKKKKKMERTRFRESTHTYRQKEKSSKEAAPTETAAAAPATTPATKLSRKARKKNASGDLATMKPGKREKIRYGKAPTKTLPDAPETVTEDAGAVDKTVVSAPEPVNPLEAARPTQKTRYTARAKTAPKAKGKGKGTKQNALAPEAPDAAEIADRQTQVAPLGLGGNTAPEKRKKKAATTTGDKTRLAAKKKKKASEQTPGDVPLGLAPAPKSAQ
jgi:peptidyl-prolyl cis-trans isomerase SurA